MTILYLLFLFCFNLTQLYLCIPKTIISSIMYTVFSHWEGRMKCCTQRRKIILKSLPETSCLPGTLERYSGDWGAPETESWNCSGGDAQACGRFLPPAYWGVPCLSPKPEHGA
ncbi:hypothetical protein LDENG_00078030 [Lucifuga dentata]|nr:hypothetical protein LDENG_00078030 [Lucifuga dentata]